MISRDVERGVQTGAAVTGVAVTGLMLAYGNLPKAQRFRVLKLLGLLCLAFIALLCMVVAIGIFFELPKTPVADKSMMDVAMVVMVLPMLGVLYGFKRFFSK